MTKSYLEAARVVEDGVFDAERVHLPRSVLLRLRPDCEPEDEQGKDEGAGKRKMTRQKKAEHQKKILLN